MQNLWANNNRGFREHMTTFGHALRLFAESFTPKSLRLMERGRFTHYLTVMGLRSFPLVSCGSIFVGLATTTQVVIEAQKYNAQDLSGGIIALGLLREMAPLTVGLAWASRVSAFLTETAFAERKASELEFSGDFMAPAYLASVASALALGAYGLVIGFVVAAIYAPTIGVSSTADFLESARQVIKVKDVAVYLFKLVVIMPLVVIFSTCLAALKTNDALSSSTARAITYVAIMVFVMNLVCTWAWYLP